jgi:sigma-B regulation protein RsbU (phosphoserine phosphatase)
MVFAYREHQSLRDRQLELESEIAVAANMQQTLLPEVIPYSESLDNGVISVPAHKMSGDYYHYIKDENGCVGVAIADIIGKGVPAALCMSMIKYAMDSLPEQRLQPAALLETLIVLSNKMYMIVCLLH